MKKFRRIVVGSEIDRQCVELTPGAQLAIDQARWVAERVGAHLTLVHSKARDECWDGRQMGYVLKEEQAPEKCRAVLDEVACRLREGGVRTDIIISAEPAWRAIARAAQSEEADLVIVGKRTECDDGNRKLGSVTMNLLRNCPAAVWAVDPDADPSYRTILAATDLTAVGRRVLEIAASLADAKGARLHVAHAYQMPLDVQFGGAREQEEFDKKCRADATETIRRQLREIDGSEDAEIHVGLTSPTRAIMECIERLAPDLVVMGTISRGGIPGVLVGNTAERLFARLDCSLLTVKPADFACPLAE